MANRLLLRNISWLALGNALTRPLWLLFITVICVPILGDAGYGIFTATLALTAIGATISDLGITPFTVREVTRQRPQAGRYFSNFLVAKSFLALLAITVVLGIGWVLGYRDHKLIALAWAGGYTLGLQLTGYCRAYYQAAERMEYEAVSVTLEKVLVISLGLFFLLRYKTAVAVLAGMALGIMLTLVLNLAWTHRRIAAFQLRLLSKSFIKGSLPTALPLGLAAQFTVIYFRTDAVMVEAMVSEAAAGQYGVAYRMMEAVVLIAAIVTTAVYPRLSALFHEKQGPSFTKIFRWALAVMVTLGLFVAFSLFWFSVPLMDVIKGGITVEASAKAVRILAWAAPVMCVNYLLGITLSAANDQRMLAWMKGGAALLNVVLNALLIPFYSFYGAAAATVATEGAILLMMGYRYLRHISQHLTPSALKG